MTLARAELVRGHVLGEGSHPPPDGRIVVELEGERPPLTAERDVGAETSADVGSQSAKTVLLVSSEDMEVLQTIQAFVLLQERLAARQTTELERLIEILEVAMPASSVRPDPAVVEQACRNVEFRFEFLNRYDALDAGEVDDRFSSKTDDTADLARAWRNDGKIFGVERQGARSLSCLPVRRRRQTEACRCEGSAGARQAGIVADRELVRNAERLAFRWSTAG